MNVITLNSPTLPVVIPPIYGLQGVGFETFTGDGPISYWNSYVGVTQMGGHGSFSDPRIGLTSSCRQPDLVTPKLPALLEYQLSLQTPAPPPGSFNRAAAGRGAGICSSGAAGCATLPQAADVHRRADGPDAGVPFLHDPVEIRHGPALRGAQRHQAVPDDAAARALAAPAVLPRRQRRRPPRRGQSLQRRPRFSLGLTEEQKADLVEFLKSL